MKKRIRVFILLVATLFATVNVVAQESDRLEGKRSIASGGYNFWLYTPDGYDANAGEAYPLIISLHGASLCGHNLQRVLRYGPLDAVSKGMRIPAVIIAPQNPGGAWNPSKINDLLEWTASNYNVDRERVYVLGMSLGGYGTMDFAGSYPDKVAAAMALCGGCSLKDQQGLGDVPLWIIHGTADRAVGISQSKSVVKKLESAGNDNRLRYDWLPGASHGALARVFYLKDTYTWLFSHSLSDRSRSVNRDLTITNSSLTNVYRSIPPRTTRLLAK
ncbi:MAG: dienelactone hydrolase family protein [Muribaculaceae bacterium]|nr:dienelactone hydrolase family protein [Muribaculaceae bacterium]